MAIRSEELIYRRDAVVYRFPRASRRRSREIARRRIALGCVALSVTVAGIFATGPGGTAPAASSQDAPRSVVVGQGDTLWDVAERYAPAHMDVRPYIDAILQKNGLSALPGEGTRIRLP